MSVTYIRAQSYNNALANYRIASACEGLSAAELAEKRTSFFPSIIDTLNHILTVDWFYVSAVEGECMGYAAFEVPVPCPALAQLVAAQRAIDARLIAASDALDDAMLAESVYLVRDTRTQVERRDRTLLHLFQHQIHHRGQVHAMLSGTTVKPPQLDEFFLGDATEQSFRQADFAALGFDEDAIWRT